MSDSKIDIDSLKKQLISQVDSSSLDDSSKSHLRDKISSSSQEELLSLISQGQKESNGSDDVGSTTGAGGIGIGLPLRRNISAVKTNLSGVRTVAADQH